MSAKEISLRKLLHNEDFPLSSKYDPEWVIKNQMGPNALWLTEWLCRDMALRPGMRVLDMGCGKAMSSIFLAKEYGVQVWATDLWISATDNWKRIREAGVEQSVFPMHAEARSLPYGEEFFDAVVSIDSYRYYGTDVHYLEYHILKVLKRGGGIGIVSPASPNEIPRPLPAPSPLMNQRRKCNISKTTFSNCAPTRAAIWASCAWWRAERRRNEVTQNPDNAEHNGKPSRGRVFKKSLGQYSVNVDGRVVVCSISSKLRKELIYPTANPASVRPRVVAVEDIKSVGPVAVGDMVSLGDSRARSGMITEILPRRNKFSRRAAGAKPLEQVIVANMDQIVAVFAAARPAPEWDVLDRYLAQAEAVGVSTLICMAKVDLVEDELLVEEVRTYEKIGYRVVFTSALTGRGKHTTSHLEMFDLDFGGSVVDTPGMREFGLWDIVGKDVVALFPEMRRYIGLCRFGADCSHSHEPGFAIKEAVEADEIAPSRYRSYLRIRP